MVRLQSRLSILTSLIFIFSIQSCSYVQYTTTSSITPISETPSTLKKKGDIEVMGGAEVYNVSTNGSIPWETNSNSGFGVNNTSVYTFLEKLSFEGTFNAAVSNNFAIGIGYQGGAKLPASSHSVNASFQYFKLFPTKEERNFRVNVKTGFQYNTGQNFMSVDEVYWTGYEIEAPEGTYLYYDREEYPLGYYKINEKSINAFIQPSLSYENPRFEVHIGAVAGYHHILEYQPEFELRYVEMNIQEYAASNPLVYYDLNRNFAFGEVFASVGFGPEFLHFMFKVGHGLRSDDIQTNYQFFQAGIKGRFNVAKKTEEVIKEF